MGRSEDHDGALDCFVRATCLQPDVFSTWYQKAVALTALGRYKEAIKSYKSARKLNPEDASTEYNLGLLLFQLKRYKEARPRLRMARKLGHASAEYALQDLEAASHLHEILRVELDASVVASAAEGRRGGISPQD